MNEGPEKAKAVVFTHFGPRDMTLLDAAQFEQFYDKYGPWVRSCLRCSNIAVVYVYVSYGIEEYVRAIEESKQAKGGWSPRSPVDVPFAVMLGDERFANALRMTVARASAELSAAGDAVSQPPQFEFIGIVKLANLLHKLWQRKPLLVGNLSYQGHFTYDSPKFVEAVIRLVRAKNDPHRYPILRVDADVLVDKIELQKIIDKASYLVDVLGMQYYWFSGSYKGSFPGDPVNEYAVRQHWLVDEQTRRSPGAYRLRPGADKFLVDLGQLGAMQHVSSAVPPSRACRAIIRKRKGVQVSRPSPQVISGAGLVTSVDAIKRLPPFMNAQAMIVWIDDHLKRQLHEAIGDMRPEDPERLLDAKLQQNRHPGGIPEGPFGKGLDEYFVRLLLGCLMHATIKKHNGSRGPLADSVAYFIDYPREFPADEAKLKAKLERAAKQRYDEALYVWRRADYGDDALRTWAKRLDASDKDRYCKMAAEVGASYVRLLLDWQEYVTSIESLLKHEAYWLFV